MPDHRSRVDNPWPRWALAVLLAVLWHAAVYVIMDRSRVLWPETVQASPPGPIELVFAPVADERSPAPTEEPKEPSFFSEQPEDRVDMPPERADYLSNVDSRARDQAEGTADTQLPRLRGESEAPHVAMDPSPAGQNGSSAGQSDLSGETDIQGRDEASEPSPPEPAPEGVEELPKPDTDPDALGKIPRAGRPSRQGDPRRDLVNRRAGRAPQPPRYLVGVGRQTLFQEEMDNPLGNVSLFGDVSLNTIAWAYAPWLQRFARDFHRNWYPPYAYLLGIIHGQDVVELEVGRDGRLLRMDVLEEEGHESLAQASVAAFRATAPYQPLPEDFPEETLILRITLVYPERR